MDGLEACMKIEHFGVALVVSLALGMCFSFLAAC